MQKAQNLHKKYLTKIKKCKEFKAEIKKTNIVTSMPFCNQLECELNIKNETSYTSRCLKETIPTEPCFYCNKPTQKCFYFAKAY